MLSDCAENQNRKLSGVQTSGGLKKVVDEAQEMFIFAEQWFHKTIETEGHLKKNWHQSNDWGAPARCQDNRFI